MQHTCNSLDEKNAANACQKMAYVDTWQRNTNYYWISNMVRCLIVAFKSCGDRTKNQDETDVDCGGLICPKCDDMKVCKTALDCVSKVCTFNICQGSFIDL